MVFYTLPFFSKKLNFSKKQTYLFIKILNLKIFESEKNDFYCKICTDINLTLNSDKCQI